MRNTPFDPAEHSIRDVPCIEAYRRETGFENLVAVYHKTMGTWVLALQSFDKRDLWELCFLDGEDGQGTTPTKEAFQGVVRQLKTGWKTARERRSELRAHHEGIQSGIRSTSQDHDAACMGMYRLLRQEHGHHKADEYLRKTGLKDPGIRVFT